jgi:glycine/D-amino acid oxidase-like deaminating enzyme
MKRRIVIIGAGVVGVAVADALVARGETDVLVVDKGPLFATGGSSSHAPGLVSRTSTSKFLSETAAATIDTYLSLDPEGGPALLPVGTLEVAYNEARLAELWRRFGAAQTFGWRGRMIGADEAVERWPIIEPEGLLGAYATTGEGLANALRAVEALEAGGRPGGAGGRAGASSAGPRWRPSSPTTAASAASGPPTATPSTPTSSSAAPGSGGRGSRRWSGSTFRCCRWSTSTR